MSDVETLKAKKSDVAYTLAKGGISAIPVVGGAASEIFSLIVSNPLSKRDEWIESLAEQLNELSERIEGFHIENLAYNNLFLSVVSQTTRIANRNHQKEKIKILQNTTLNSALKTIFR